MTSPEKYVVLMGDAGSGKSTIVEKLTGEVGRSSDADESFTRSSECFVIPTKGLVICDTPGSDAMSETFMQNLWIAQAVNFQPVSKLLVTVKAVKRIDNVVKLVREYADRFSSMDPDLLGVIVTHMDEVTWTKERCTQLLSEKLSITDVVFSRKDPAGAANETPASATNRALLQDIIRICKKVHTLSVDHENFLKLFKINSDKQDIVRSTKSEVDAFKRSIHEFYEERKMYNSKDMVDLVFEFQAWAKDEIMKAQMRISDKHNFTFIPSTPGDAEATEKAADEAAHISNMANQMVVLLVKLRTEALGYQAAHGVNVLKRCPHCNVIWAKFQGCDGATTCGALPSRLDVRAGFSVFGTFTFEWNGTKLKITKNGTRQAAAATRGMASLNVSSSAPLPLPAPMRNQGCGRSITWSEMPIARVPSEFADFDKAKPVSGDDVSLLPVSKGAPQKWETLFKDAVKDVKITRKQC